MHEYVAVMPTGERRSIYADSLLDALTHAGPGALVVPA